MSKKVGLIISAGKETRFDDSLPKALQTYKCRPLLEHNVEILGKYVDEVIVVVNNNNEVFFKDYRHIVIDSGHGCGDAVLKALVSIGSKYENVAVLWGDCIAHETVVERTVSSILDNYDMIIPCHYEESPYVRLLPIGSGHVDVEFGKYGEVNGCGYHDFGFFYFHYENILRKLQIFASNHANGDGYIHVHGNELQFLDMLNDTDCLAKIIDINDIVPLSFNTKKELYGLQQ